MVSTRKRRQSNGWLLSKLDHFEQNFFGNALSERPENTAVNESTVDKEITVVSSDSNPAVDENVVNVKTLERCFKDRIEDRLGSG